MEFLLFGFGVVSRVVEVGVVSVAADSMPAIGAAPEAPAPAPVVASRAGITGSPITRDAMSRQTKCSERETYRSTYQQQRHQNRPSLRHRDAWPLPSTPASRPFSQPCLRA